MKIQQRFLTNNACYISGAKLNPTKLMVHSTACPGVPAINFVNGWNTYAPGGRLVCVHGFIDNANVYQTLPFNFQGWHCGGAGNQQAIGFELCEPKDYSDKTYFNKVIKNAIELYAYLCKTYRISPSNIISHKEGCAMGIASNHGDPDHWWKHVGYTMDNFRNDVQKELNKTSDPDGVVSTGGTLQGTTDVFGVVSYQAHMRGIGWGNWQSDGSMVGSVNQSRRIEALRINPVGNTDVSVHMKGIGDKTFNNITKDTVLGTTGEERRIEALMINSSETIYFYRVHQKKVGWSEWKTNGEWAGVKGQSLQVEAVEIKVAAILVKGHIQSKGWTNWVPEKSIIGTVGESLRLEAIMINPLEKDIEAQAHIQGYGWIDYGKITKDTVIGTVGESKRLECIRLKGDFEYRVHIQGSGWTDWTKADGISTLGTVGQSLRVEAMEIR